jgi:hypothetical protein
MNQIDILKTIRAILNYGIDVETKTKAEEIKMILDLHNFILTEEVKVQSFLEGDKLTIETPYFDPIMIVEIENSIMSIIPITDQGFYNAFTVILDFLHNMAEKKHTSKPKKKKYVPREDEFEWI